MNVGGYIATNSWGYDVAQTSQTTSTNKSFTIPTEEFTSEKQTQKELNNASTNPFNASSFDFKDWCANKEPLFDINMYTKTEPTRSDEEILKDMAELARKHARQGTTFQEPDEEFLALMKEYMSSVSPDREGILNRAVNEIIGRTRQGEDYTRSEIYQQINSQTVAQRDENEKAEKEKDELLDYFLKLVTSKGNTKGSNGTISSITGNADCYTVTIDNGGGMTTTLGYVNGQCTGMSISGNNYYNVQLNQSPAVPDNAMFTDDDGNLIATYGGRGGFHCAPTGEEIERRKEILAAYNAGYDFAIGKYNPPPSAEAYNDTYIKTHNDLTKSAYA